MNPACSRNIPEEQEVGSEAGGLLGTVGVQLHQWREGGRKKEG